MIERGKPENNWSRPWRNGQEPERGCLDEAVLAAYVDEKVFGGGDRESIERHLATCEICRDQVGFLVRMQEEPAPEGAPAGWVIKAREVAAPSVTRWQLGWGWGAAAAATACVLLAAALWLKPAPETQPSVPTASPAPRAEVLARAETKPLPPPKPGPVVRKQAAGTSIPEVVFPKPHSTVAREGLVFRWKEIRGALGYEVRLVNAEGDVLWELRTQDHTARVAPNLVLARGETFFLWVRADLPDGRAVQSKAIPFTIAGEK